MILPEHLRRRTAVEKLRAELREITERLIVDLHKELGLDKPWIQRGFPTDTGSVT